MARARLSSGLPRLPGSGPSPSVVGPSSSYGWLQFSGKGVPIVRNQPDPRGTYANPYQAGLAGRHPYAGPRRRHRERRGRVGFCVWACDSPCRSCRISGDFATCVASGNATGTVKNIYVHVSALPNQQVDVAWSMTCVKGSGAASSSGQFTATTPVRKYLKMPFFRASSCSVASNAQLSGTGSLHVWNTYHRVSGT